jgi:peptide-methionine (S)-S-oxide reductase
METFVLAGGCFWCLDAVYRTLKGVSDVVSGYTGGHTVSPSYHEVTTGRTGHAEAVKVVILDVFFTLHDPRQLNRQGNDIGTQYRSAMFYVGDAQKAQFERARDRAGQIWEGEIVTQIVALDQWWDAEPYHQDFFAKNPGQGYCMAVALPKVAKVRRSYAEYVAT